MSNIPARKRPSELVTRAVVGVALIGLALGALILGKFVFWLLVVTLGLLMMSEWAGLVGANARMKQLAMFALVVPLAIMAPLAAGPGFFALGLVFATFFFIGAISRSPWLAGGALYVGLPILSLLLIRQQPEFGLYYTLWTLALVWTCDIGAYFAGKYIGGPKLAPAISPNKTWAGLIGGMVFATIFAIAMHVAVGLAWRLTLATPVLALVSQGGDLFESWLKRRAGQKDSGNLLPGHGGVLDRLDGLVPVAPLAAFLVVVVPKLYALLP
ncbi:MAG: phosphatidate cytidylyltransferase [Pseudomonadota bacterium]